MQLRPLKPGCWLPPPFLTPAWCFLIFFDDVMMMMMMSCFCGLVDQRKAFSLISSRDHCQRSSPLRISDMPSRVWTCAEPEFRLSWMKLCSSDNHYTTPFVCYGLSDIYFCILYRKKGDFPHHIEARQLAYQPFIHWHTIHSILFIPYKTFYYLFLWIVCTPVKIATLFVEWMAAFIELIIANYFDYADVTKVWKAR